MTKLYETNAVPLKYVCTDCGATNCKLWRLYQTFANHTPLLCAECAGKREDKNVSTIDADGRRLSDIVSGHRTDQIGWYIPAVPTEEGDTYWGYTSVPEDGCRWWRRLPTLPTAKVSS